MIIIKSQKEIEYIREAGKILANIIDLLKQKIKPGITTKDIDVFAEEFILKYGAEPAFKGYKGFPATVCASINEELVHGIPSEDRILQEGDIVSIDVGAKKHNYYADMAYTYAVGNISKEKKDLIAVTKKSLELAIKEALVGGRLYTISNAIQSYVEDKGYSIVRDYVGHGIGKNLHEDPQIPNYGDRNTGERLKEGMVFALEPMVNVGTYKTKVLKDGWTVVTQDNKPSAHFEHTIVLKNEGPEILTYG
jgi:methionyl aminopeptidase